MTAFSRGTRAPIPGEVAGRTVTVDLVIDGPGEWDGCCVGLDADERLSDDRFLVFYNQPSAPGGVIEKVESVGGRGDSFRVRLDRLPRTIQRLAFCAAVDDSSTAAVITGGMFRIAVDGAEVMTYRFAGADFSVERAIIVAEIYLKDKWRMAAVGQGYPGGLAELLTSYGADIDDDPEPAPPPAPAPPSAPVPPVASQPIGQAGVPPVVPPPAPPAAPGVPPKASRPGSPPVPPGADPPGQPGSSGHSGQPEEAPVPLPAWATRVRPGALVSLRKYLAKPSTARWTRQGPYMVRVDLGPEVYARRGSMVAYRGKIDFRYKGSGGLRPFFEGRATGQQLSLMACRGEGPVFLAEGASDLHIVELNGQSLCVNASNVLAFDATLRTEVRRIESAGLPGGGMFHLQIGGQGTVVVMTRGTPLTLPVVGPTFVDTQAVVAWTAGVRISVTSQVRIVRNMYEGRSGEGAQLQFMAMNGHFVVVQPYEV